MEVERGPGRDMRVPGEHRPGRAPRPRAMGMGMGIDLA